MPVRLIATDIDGTLLSSSRVIPPENVAAIHAAQRRGIVVAAATGRFTENAYALLERFSLRCPIIGINGAHIADDQLRVIEEKFMLPGAGERTQAILEEIGSDYFIFGRHLVCSSRKDLFHHSEVGYGDRLRALGVRYFHGAEDARRIVRDSIYKIFVCNNVPLMTVRERLRGIEGIQLTQSSPNNIEVMPLGVDKGRGLRDFALSMGIPLEDTMALGDEENDIPMLAAAGLGVAMGNGSRLARAAAREVTDANDQCGFARAVRAYALEEKTEEEPHAE